LTKWLLGIVSRLVTSRLWSSGSTPVRCRRHTIDDSGATLVDLDASDERTNELPTLVPIESIDPASDLHREVSEASGHHADFHTLRKIVLRPGQLLRGGTEPRANTFRAVREVG
jgi:hypothetical protein